MSVNDVYSMVGSKLYVSATLPTTPNAAGYAALTWTEVAILESFDTIQVEQALNTMVQLSTGLPINRPGAYTLPTLQLMMGATGTDAGELAIKAKFEEGVTSRKLMAVKEVFPNGDIVYMQVTVHGYGNVNGDSGAIAKTQATLTLDSHLPIYVTA